MVVDGIQVAINAIGEAIVALSATLDEVEAADANGIVELDIAIAQNRLEHIAADLEDLLEGGRP